MIVLSMMPRLHIETKTVVEGEDDGHELTAGCVVTLKVTLRRSRLIDPQEAGIDDQYKAYDGSDDEEQAGNDEENQENAEEVEVKKAKKPWEKNKPKQKKKKANNASGGKKFVKKTQVTSSPASEGLSAEEKEEKGEKAEAKDEQDSDASDDESASDSDSGKEAKSGHDSESEWEDDVQPKKNIFETKSTETHVVHAPFYPTEKFEWWWVTLAMVGREKTRLLVTAPQIVKTLTDEETVSSNSVELFLTS